MRPVRPVYVAALASTLALIAFGWFGAAPRAAADSAGPALIQSGGRGLFEPASFCPSNHSCFSNAEWVRWGSTAVAWADGVTRYPDAAEYSQRAKVTLWRPRGMCGGRRYTRARWQYEGDSAVTRSTFLPLAGCGYWTGA